MLGSVQPSEVPCAWRLLSPVMELRERFGSLLSIYSIPHLAGKLLETPKEESQQVLLLLKDKIT